MILRFPARRLFATTPTAENRSSPNNCQNWLVNEREKHLVSLTLSWGWDWNVAVKAISTAASGAVQAADRWRPLANRREVLKLQQRGSSRRDIARQLKMSRTPVAKLVNADGFPERAAKRQKYTKVGRFVDQLRAR